MSVELPVRSHSSGATIDVVVQPRASVSAIVGVHDGALRLRITAPPVDGAANKAIVELLSSELGVRKSDIEIVSGQSNRRKRLLIRGINVAELKLRLADRLR